jgi:hypothetical protein
MDVCLEAREGEVRNGTRMKRDKESARQVEEGAGRVQAVLRFSEDRAVGFVTRVAIWLILPVPLVPFR